MKGKERIVSSLVFLLLFSLLAVDVDAKKKRKSSSSGVKCDFYSAYLTHNEYNNGAKGLKVHYNFNLVGMQYKEIECTVFLYEANDDLIYFTDGTPATNTWYSYPDYYSSGYFDKWTFFKYAFDLPYGTTKCYAIVRVYNAHTGRLLGKSPKLTFDYTRR